MPPIEPELTLGELVGEARKRLSRAPFRPPVREAFLLAGRVFELTEAQVLARSRQEVPQSLARRFTDMLDRRLSGEPFAYLFGEKEFFGRPFHVDSRVLIPRPETEHLVEAALADLPRGARCLDLGTGSGCVAITLALERPDLRVHAADRSPAALALARSNLERYGLSQRLPLVTADLLDGVRAATYDLVVANLPYVDPQERGELSPEVTEFEPQEALFPGASGEALFERLFAQAHRLRRGAKVILEIGHGQLPWFEVRTANAVLALEGVRKDYAQIPRIVELRRS